MHTQKNDKLLTKKEYKTRIVIKSVFFVIALFITAATYIQTALFIYDESAVRQKRERAEDCAEYLQTGEYRRLRRTLVDYEMYEDEYDRYWEMADAHDDYRKYMLWKSAAVQEGADSLYGQKAAHYEAKVLENYENCQFEENKKRLEEFIPKGENQ